MEEIVKIFEEHLIWVIVGGVLLVMIIIGYYAEKTNFGRKKTSPVKDKSDNEPVPEVAKESEEVVEPEIKEEKKDDANLEKTEVIDIASVKEKKEKTEESEEDMWKF